MRSILLGVPLSVGSDIRYAKPEERHRRNGDGMRGRYRRDGERLPGSGSAQYQAKTGGRRIDRDATRRGVQTEVVT